MPEEREPGNKKIAILRNVNNGKESKPQKYTPTKSLHQKKIEYEEARVRIFGKEINCGTRNFKKIQKLRDRTKKIRKGRKLAIETVVKLGEDNRFFAKTLVDGKEITALLDSGAGACCIGKNSLKFLENLKEPVIN